MSYFAESGVVFGLDARVALSFREIAVLSYDTSMITVHFWPEHIIGFCPWQSVPHDHLYDVPWMHHQRGEVVPITKFIDQWKLDGSLARADLCKE